MTTIKLSIGDVDDPMQTTIVIGFQRYIKAAKSPESTKPDNKSMPKLVPYFKRSLTLLHFSVSFILTHVLH